MAPSVTLVRHGATAWSVSGQHTSTTDLPLLPEGEAAARALAAHLAGRDFAEVVTSPLQRARRTAELAGFPDAEPVDDLIEWRYGSYEGRTTPEIRAERPDWSLWRDGCPEGDSPDQVAARCDRVVARILAADGPVLVFAHGHLLRTLTARWLGLSAADGRLFRLDTATTSELGHERENRVILRWNA